MKWTRCGNHSTGYIDVCHYICITHMGSEYYEYVYAEKGSRIFHRAVKANNWDEAEQLVVKKIQDELAHAAEYWCRLWRNFNEEVNANETLD